ncbi:concentrative nucleoside transporter, CNT family [Desulfacinum hydrothermale DSM 13146]|uniref:Concentrative nucleoside transporter, CNT family n=1 Tax=Desulfacinum hydrothermale DSM 13146 TaxID=1121390 RepID=A0A1W1XM92_9BACT|nr:nucleoside transporter C-terminal domain-containing protein [Desulfacinum hydrothermale]SMC24974.1 concentrative nucleoside transporter, CNT family [Desulfacinum hydrothermale DSM 13146]
MLRLQSALGLLMLVLVAWMFSEDRHRLAWREVAGGIVLQIVLALILLKMPGTRLIFSFLNQAVQALSAATEAGTGFVFGYLGGGEPPFQVRPGASTYILAFRGLPLVLVMSALSSLLFHWGVIPRVVRALAWMLKRTTGISGVEALGAAANIFVGMVEAPILVRPYLEKVSRSELFTIMVAGMATIAGTVMVLYASILEPVMDGVMGHLLVASIISAPAAVTVSKLMVPPVERGVEGALPLEREARSAMDALTQGTLAGLTLLLNIIAMLIVFVALVHLANMVLGLAPAWGGEPWTVQRILGVVMAPVTWLMGIPWSEARTAGSLMGVKTILNEFLAYLQMASLPADVLSPRSRLILTYALCGFANMGSLGIMIGGLGAMAPARRPEIVELGVRSIVAGTLATCMTGAIIGLLV